MSKIMYKGNIYLCTDIEEKSISDDDVSIYEKILYFDKEKFVRLDKRLYKKDAYLLRVRKNIYADFDDIQNILIFLEVLLEPRKQEYIDLIYSFPKKENDLFVRKQELKPLYVDKDKIKKVVSKKIKK